MFSRLKTINRIILSAGHGGLGNERHDPGATSGVNTENEEVKQIILKLSAKLTSNQFTVVVLPDYGLYKTLTYLNSNYDAETDWALEIHKDSTGTFNTATMSRRTGIYYHPALPESRSIADEMVKIFKLNGAHQTSWSRPDNASNHHSLAWIRKPKMLSHLIECGFMQGNLDVNEDEFYATIIAKGVCGCVQKAGNKMIHV
jgi:N-acetylmuramoyl-L-alanine amidase